MPEFIARVQAEPGNWRYGLPASGSIPHLVVEDTKIATSWICPPCLTAARRNPSWR
jgi:hypothetical protein